MQLVVIGTYEGSVVGFELLAYEDLEKEWDFKPVFSSSDHTSNVRCLGQVEKFLLSGSDDETIQVFDIEKFKESGFLSDIAGTVTGIDSVRDGKKLYAIASSEDGCIRIWDTTNWNPVKKLFTNRAGISCVAVHSSGKLALSGGKDRMLRAWNLGAGSCSSRAQMDAEIDYIAWAPDGTHYAMALGRRVELRTVLSDAVLGTVTLESRATCLEWLSPAHVAVGHKDLWVLKLTPNGDAFADGGVISFETDDRQRVRGVAAVAAAAPGVHGIPPLVAALSDGELVALQPQDGGDGACVLDVVGRRKVTAGPTCMCVCTVHK